MPDDDRIAELLFTWEEQLERGRRVSAEELCCECPHLLGRLRDEIHARQATRWMWLESPPPAPDGPQRFSPSDAPLPAPPSGRPTTPGRLGRTASVLRRLIAWARNVWGVKGAVPEAGPRGDDWDVSESLVRRTLGWGTSRLELGGWAVPGARPCWRRPRPAPRPLPSAPALTDPHHCYHCRVPIAAATGVPRVTVDCPACGSRASLYATHYTCPTCGALLESPSSREGAETACPACRRPIRVPYDLLHAQRDGSMDRASWYAFDCAGCAHRLIAHRQDVGKAAVCPHCHLTQTVPVGGYFLGESPE